ncbi:MAG: hypothetical protein J6W75_00840 [Bacteroidaceae bacterium]|nr:hypothetical protein [Bacteroidaceae bacterium]
MKQLIYLPPLRRLLAVLVVLVFAALPSWAVEDQTALHLIFKDGSSTWFLLAEKPVLTFTGTQMSVNTRVLGRSVHPVR